MFNRVKNAIVNAVAGDTLTDNNNRSTVNNEQNSANRIKYERPVFLEINESGIDNAVDHKLRPIIVLKDISTLPFNSGYGECVNAGKSELNEDQASFACRTLQRVCRTEQHCYQIPYFYFGLFDGHAGFGSAIAASRQLHHIVHEKLVDVLDELIFSENLPDRVTRDTLIVGALEQSFFEMDELIAQNLAIYNPAGGCTALVMLMILGKVYIANAGDSRAVLCLKSAGLVKPLSRDHTPVSERDRVRFLAAHQPTLLGSEFTNREFLKKPSRSDLGKRVLYRDALMNGWASKTLRADDLKVPVVYGEGKRGRVMGTIGVTRGFGDHTLTGMNTNLLIKPFLSSHPEVEIVNLSAFLTCPDDVIVLGTDGLWDVTSNEQAYDVIMKSLQQFPDEPHRYISAAQALVAYARGKPGERSWRMSDSRYSSVDDISVFVIPIDKYNRTINLNPNTNENGEITLSKEVKVEQVLNIVSAMDDFFSR